MKLITAFIQPDKLSDVKQALFDANIKKMSVTNSLGCGQQGGFQEHYRGRSRSCPCIAASSQGSDYCVSTGQSW